MPRDPGPVVKATRRGEKVPLPDENGDIKLRPAPFDGLHISTKAGCIMYIDARSAWRELDELID